MLPIRAKKRLRPFKPWPTAPPGRYSLNLPFPGRVQVLALGSKSLMPIGFELQAGEAGPLQIVVSLKTAQPIPSLPH
jgi:hypothetical protein